MGLLLVSMWFLRGITAESWFQAARARAGVDLRCRCSVCRVEGSPGPDRENG